LAVCAFANVWTGMLLLLGPSWFPPVFWTWNGTLVLFVTYQEFRKRKLRKQRRKVVKVSRALPSSPQIIPKTVENADPPPPNREKSSSLLLESSDIPSPEENLENFTTKSTPDGAILTPPNQVPNFSNNNDDGSEPTKQLSHSLTESLQFTKESSTTVEVKEIPQIQPFTRKKSTTDYAINNFIIIAYSGMALGFLAAGLSGIVKGGFMGVSTVTETDF